MKWLLPALLVLSLPLTASAHGLIVEARLQDGVVSVAVFYDDGDPAVNAKVTVETADKAVVVEGQTDNTGTWSFPAPPTGEYTIKANAGDGHLARVKLPIVGAESSAPMRSRGLMTAVGLLAIAVLTFGLKAVLRRRRRRSPGKSPSAE